jgi:hypothetical protein
MYCADEASSFQDRCHALTRNGADGGVEGKEKDGRGPRRPG